MNWIRKNPFLTGLVVVLVVSTIGLAFLIFTAAKKYAGIAGEYRVQAAELARLQNLAPYPEQANLKKLEAQRDEFVAKIRGLVERMMAMELPVEPLTPEQFQDGLKAAVTAVVEKAGRNGTQLPEKFYLGFDQYETMLPTPQAAPALGRQLRAVNLVVNALIENRVSAITSLKRAPVPEEADAGAKPAAATPAARPVPGAAAAPQKLVQSLPLEIELVADQSQLRQVLNWLASSKEQFLVVRNLILKNENPKPPSRTLAPAAATPPPASQFMAELTGEKTDATPAKPRRLEFLVGTERVMATLTIDIMDFAPLPSGKGS